MSYFCNDCRCVFDRRYTNCPYCGFSLSEDQRTIDQLTAEGYQLVEIRRGASSVPPVPDAPVSSQNDPLSRLRQAYRLDQDTPAHPAPESVRPAPESVRPTPSRPARSTSSSAKTSRPSSSPADESIRRSTARTTPPRSESTNPSPAGQAEGSNPPDLDAWLHTGSGTAAPNDAAGSVRNPGQRGSRQRGRQYNPPRPQTARQTEEMHRLQREARRYRFQNALHNLPWHGLFRLILILAGILIICGLIRVFFAALPVMLNGVLNLIISIMPVIIIIAAIVWCLRAIFRG